MKRQAPKLEMRYVPYLGEVGCGRPVENIIPFIPKSELVPVALPEWMPAQESGVYTVRGLSLTDFNIFDDDRLVVRQKFSWRDIKPDTICIVFIHTTGELVAKRIERGANKLILKASGGDIPDREYSLDEVEVKAIVVDVLIDVNSHIARARETKRRQTAIGRNGHTRTTRPS
jgi:SOS-response transcriptional repressor LexA